MDFIELSEFKKYSISKKNNSSSNSANKNRAKKVDFSLFRDVIIIPNKRETCDSIDLWWSYSDVRKAYSSMHDEIQVIQKIYNDNITQKEAMKILYQPKM